MTMAQSVAARYQEDRSITTWHEVDSGFWVGSAAGEFVGSVERLGRARYVARDEVSRALGEFVGLRHARNAIVARHP